MTPRLQEWIHRIEVGEGARILRVSVVLMGLLMLAAAYDWLRFRNLSTPEGMDAAQVARQVAEGRGFTTRFLRPLSLHLVGEWRRSAVAGGPAAADAPERHPDLAENNSVNLHGLHPGQTGTHPRVPCAPGLPQRDRC